MKRVNVDSLQDEIRQKKKTTLGHLLSRAGRLMTAHALKEVHDAGFPEVVVNCESGIDRVSARGVAAP